MNESPKPNEYEDDESLAISRECVEEGRNLGSVILGRVASKQGATLKWLTTRDVWAVFDDRRVAISGHFGTESALAAGIVANKHFTKELLRAAGISVPAGRRVTSADDAVSVQRDVDRPVVIKPLNGAMGRGVTVNVIEADDVRAGFHRASRAGSGVIVEQYIAGSSEFRAHATPAECVGVFQRLLPSVVGDGHSTVAELINQKNEIRKHNPSTIGNPIPIDDVAERFLRRQKLTWGSVAPAGQTIVVRDVNGITSGGDSAECLDSASEALKHTAIGAVAAIPGMDWGGVDILVDEATGNPYVIEVNTSAAISGSAFPVFGTPRDLPTLLWNRMYERAKQSHPQPIVAVKPLSAPKQLRFASNLPESEKLTLQNMLAAELERRDFQVSNPTPRIWFAKTPRGGILWFNAVLSGADLQMAINPVRKQRLFREILRAEGVPRPAGKWVRGEPQLRAFQKKTKSAVTLVPPKSSFGKAAMKRVKNKKQIEAATLSGNTFWFAQATRPGLRFRLVATPDEGLMITAPRNQARASKDVIEQVSILASKAVRAVPELRWGVVDVMHRFPEQVVSGKPRAFVEDLTVNPTFRSDSQIIGGSLESVFDFLVEGAS